MQDVHHDIIKRFYESFQAYDVQGMQSCYHPDVEFSDEVFPLLRGGEAKAMWHMLLANPKSTDLRIIFSNIKTSGDNGSCDWEAFYTFSLTGRKVHNKIHATFQFRDGLISRHTDKFDFWRWAGMAFGVKGIFLGWTDFFRRKVQDTVAKRLASFVDKNPEYTENVNKITT